MPSKTKTKKTNLTSDRCVYFAGPYKGYCGQAEYDADERLFHGRVIGTKDVITFEADGVRGVQPAFVDSIEDYLAFCAERHESPEKPFSGKFVTRIEPELHRILSMIAESSGQSLNALVSESLAAIAKTAIARGVSRLPKSGTGRFEQRTSSPTRTIVTETGKAIRHTKKSGGKRKTAKAPQGPSREPAK